jgi:hypothetical protein
MSIQNNDKIDTSPNSNTQFDGFKKMKIFNTIYRNTENDDVNEDDEDDEDDDDGEEQDEDDEDEDDDDAGEESQNQSGEQGYMKTVIHDCYNSYLEFSNIDSFILYFENNVLHSNNPNTKEQFLELFEDPLNYYRIVQEQLSYTHAVVSSGIMNNYITPNNIQKDLHP